VSCSIGPYLSTKVGFKVAFSGIGTRLLAKMGSDAAMYPAALNLLEGLRSVTCPVAPDLASMWGGLWTVMCPAAICGLRVTSVKKRLACLPIQHGSSILNTHTHVFKASDVRAIMGLQDVRVGGTVKTCKACRHAATLHHRPC
jgi:hypothetical protein